MNQLFIISTSLQADFKWHEMYGDVVRVKASLGASAIYEWSLFVTEDDRRKTAF